MSLVSDRLQPLRIVAALPAAIVVVACSADVTVESTAERYSEGPFHEVVSTIPEIISL